MTPPLSATLRIGGIAALGMILAAAVPPLAARLAPPRPAGLSAAAVIAPNDNTKPAGQLKGGVLSIRLEARMGAWFPEGASGKSLDVAAWAEEGKPLQNPGPVIRVRQGNEVHATIRNTLAKPITVYGFGATRGLSDSVVIEPGKSLGVSFKATTTGTFYYAATMNPGPIYARLTEDTQLNGVIIVDPPSPAAPPKDRVFLISWWFTIDSTSKTGLGSGTMTINGLSWPHTERLELTQGDTAHWRLVNVTGSDHPMHLHGFYFRMDAKGDGTVDTIYAPPERRMAVTEIINPGQTMALTWSPTRPGNWIFHCHFAGHLSHLVALDTDKGMNQTDDMEQMHHPADMPHQMYGLVLGIRVAPHGTPAARSTAAPRTMRLLVRSKPNVYGEFPGYAYVLGGTRDASNAAALTVPGPVLVLEKGQPVAVTIVNQTHEPTAVHWHGIELDSYPDGVPGWSGSGTSILPPIAPGDSYTVRFTPPRAGTFMYHSHFNEFQQITSGLHGAIVVLEPGQRFNPDLDRILLFSDSGPTVNVIQGPYPPVMLNGKVHPDPLELRAGVTYRFRVVGITGDLPETVALLEGEKPVNWRAVAKDGADLPASQATMRPAQLLFDPGEIYDFEFTPRAAGELTLKYGAPEFLHIPGATPTLVPVHVR
jgi:manganese oxidase